VRLGVEAAVVEGALVPGDVEIEDGRVVAVGLSDGHGSGIAAPGFVDLHLHGFGGVDFAHADAGGYRRAGAALLASGVTAFRPTLLSAAEAELVAALREVPSADIGPRVLGCHVEGPFLAPSRLGMHPPEARRDPELAFVERLLAAGPVAHMTLAPELPGALELVDELVARGVTVACGHTDATADAARAAFGRGATHVTHLFNAMRPFTHRDPGIAGATLAHDSVTFELILDGNHIADDAVRLAWRAGRGRVVLVTDAIGATGDGTWRVGPVEVEVHNGVVRGGGGELAGSMLTMPRAIRALMSAGGASLAEAIDAATRVPAAAAGRDDVGVLRPGAPADVVVVDEDVNVLRVLVDGASKV
jgi:N-acetylglucosamine-6-phosphate deacetylase